MDWNRINTRRLFGAIAFGVILFAALWHLGEVFRVIRLGFQMISFFLIGLSLAFILNTPLRLIETKLLSPLNKRLGRRWAKLRRPVSVVLTVLLLLAVIALVIFMVIPEIARTVSLLAMEIPPFLTRAGEWLEGLGLHYEDSVLMEQLKAVDWAKLGESALSLLRSGGSSFVSGTVNAATSLVSGAFNLFVGLILAFYVLLSKERLAGQVRRTLYAYLPERRVDSLLSLGAKANTTFGNFINGQFFESMILGSLCFLGMTIFGFKFAPMVSVLVGVTAVIPIFGAFIGCAVGAFMILINQGIVTALWFILFFVILQQIEGDLIYPHVVGKVMMLPGLWVLVAVTLGGNLAGILGMLLSVPIASLLYTLLREAVDRRNAAGSVPPQKLRPGGE